MSQSLSLSLYNTLSRQKEPLTPRVEGEISMYVCGVTPYDKLHIGHARAFLTYDALRRVLENRGLRVLHVQNVTDIDDKIIIRANEIGQDPLKLASNYHEESLRELALLDVLPAHQYPRVTGHINPILDMVAKLEERGYAYAREGDVFFDVSKDEDYGKLSGQKPEELRAGARIIPGETKDDPADFALWKVAKEGEPSWPSRYGNGRPGWHIECSAMALEILGEGFDIHGGARELVFPHHENEIAQSESFLGDGGTFAKTWWHCGELRVDGAKMSKSLGNFITLSDALEMAPKNVWRLLFLQTHPRSPLDYTEEKLLQFKNSWNRIKNALDKAPAEVGELSEGATRFQAQFNAALDDDLNTPEAIAAVFDAVSEFNRSGDEALGATARNAMEVLGFSFETEQVGDELTPHLLELLIQVRQSARERRDFKTGDQIRVRLNELGIALEDGVDGTTWKRV
ncbi:cysteine--tRNA ligase [Abditibacteriota bacterium]|nr:cysteine--tRNA ligase [Abditibacteriota bacterium]